jgi:tetratricopeptide (TPR) repeat protein
MRKTAGFWTKAALFSVVAFLLEAAHPLLAQSVAEDRYQHTDYRGSLAVLNKNTDDAATNFLIGRDYFGLGDWKQSTTFLLKATQEEPKNSEYMDWLGRVYGKRAEAAHLLAAPGFATKARESFERAVELDPKNSEALSDLFDFYLNAPGFMGGGYEKALNISNKMGAIDPPEAYTEKARLAQKHNEAAAAEANLRQAVAAQPTEVGHLVALAKFLANQGRTQESDEIFSIAEKIDPTAPRLWYARADVLIKQQRDLNQARALLEKYLQAPITPDDPPKEQALRLLKRAGGA